MLSHQKTLIIVSATHRLLTFILAYLQKMVEFRAPFFSFSVYLLPTLPSSKLNTGFVLPAFSTRDTGGSGGVKKPAAAGLFSGQPIGQ